MLDYEKNLRRNLKALMDAKGLKQDKLADLSGVSRPTIGKALSSGRVRQDKLEQIATFLEVTLDDLYSDDMQKTIDNGKKEGQSMTMVMSNPSDLMELKIERMQDGNYRVTIKTF